MNPDQDAPPTTAGNGFSATPLLIWLQLALLLLLVGLLISLVVIRTANVVAEQEATY
jgi:hypothetical protein